MIIKKSLSIFMPLLVVIVLSIGVKFLFLNNHSWFFEPVVEQERNKDYLLEIVGDRSVSIKVGESFNANDYFTALDIDGSKLEIIVLGNYSNESPDVYELTGSTVNSLGQTVTITFMLSVEGVLYV